MQKKTLIVVFGHRTEARSATVGSRAQGYCLSDVARARCDEAARLFLELLGDDVKVLGTGAFGDFNAGHAPHGLLLKEYLIQKKVPESAISGWTATFHTLEDVLASRKVFVDGGFENLIAVTDETHMARVRFIMARVFPEHRVDFKAASLPPNSEVGDEEYKLERLKNEWVDPPLYGTCKRFPTEIYQNAENEQKHYDALSYGVITAIFIVSISPFAVEISGPLTSYSWLVFLSAGLLNLVLLSIYIRMAEWARRARRLLYYTEVGWGLRGFSSNDPNQRYRWYQLPIKRLIVWVTCGLTLALLALAVSTFHG